MLIYVLLFPLSLNPTEDGLFTLKHAGEFTLLNNKTDILFVNKWSKLVLYVIEIHIA